MKDWCRENPGYTFLCVCVICSCIINVFKALAVIFGK